MTTQELSQTIAAILEENRAIEVETIDIQERSSLADVFIVCSGTSSIHVRTLAERVEEGLQAQGVKPRTIEGLDTRRWVLMDYSEVIVHIFMPEERSFYDLEKLWQRSRD